MTNLLFEEKVIIKNKTGLHARPASKFVQKASQFKSEITIILDEDEVNAKSIMGVMSLGIAKDTEIKIKAEGQDAEAALNELIEFVELKMPEEDK